MNRTITTLGVTAITVGTVVVSTASSSGPNATQQREQALVRSAVNSLTHRSVMAGTASKRGPRGPRGLRGPTGARGSTGSTGSTGPTGPAGPAGANGAAGAAGPAGAPGANGGFTAANISEYQGGDTFLCGTSSGACAVGSSVAFCPSGQVAISGGWDAPGGSPPVSATVGYDQPVAGNGLSGWEIIMASTTSDGTQDFAAVANCAG